LTPVSARSPGRTGQLRHVWPAAGLLPFFGRMDFSLFCMDFFFFYGFSGEIQPDFRRVPSKNCKKYFIFYFVLSTIFKAFAIFSKKFSKKC